MPKNNPDHHDQDQRELNHDLESDHELQNDYQSYDDYETDYQDVDQDDIYEYEDADSFEDQPWEASFDEGNANHQFSRSARNQPDKEASKLSQVLLIVLALAALTPFILFYIIDGQRSNNDIEKRTQQQVMIKKNSEKEESSARESESASSSSSSQARSQREVASRDESISAASLPERTSTEAPAPPVAEPEPAPAPTGGTHTVQAGETLYRIAVNNGVSVEALMAANGISDPSTLSVGQVLVIP